MIPSVEEMIEKYVAAWNGKSLAEFKTAFAECWAADATYTDPNYENITGVDGIAELANGSLEKIPVRTFNVLKSPDYHHNVGRYTWNVVLPEETKEGFDYFEFNEQNQITRLVSFFGPLK
ncbi:SnoaL-like domain-containing protein [Mucilaginibacter pineti]|uniref:SnoaL-like domain-containing protein n=1 Tax=Mucilaginibacter pineti TaxID=1391627 RepID=A0A1G7J692_9SPHI|nr:nuclear transport factor 2 family protein [Mucilaginibacter pineti]SDF20304.1 SnoaL-like domain-containing protein [Mucilaginibacter pineti]